MIKVVFIALILIATGIYIIINADYFRKDGAKKHKENMAKIGINVFKTPPSKYIFIFIGIVCILSAVILLLVVIIRR